MRKLKVYIADDHTLFRSAMVRLLKDFKRIEKVKEASNGKEFLDLFNTEVPDVAIMDLEMPVLDGSKTCKRLLKEFPQVKIIVVSMHDSKTQINYLLQMGVHVFLSKNVEPDELESAIYCIADNGTYQNKIMFDALHYRFFTAQEIVARNLKVELSKREHNIVQLLCQEFTNKQIGKELSLSENTIRNHKVRIMKKTGVKNTPGLVKYAFENGLVLPQSFNY
jgi:DNA-binding NarL/FixJ family response regulator